MWGKKPEKIADNNSKTSLFVKIGRFFAQEFFRNGLVQWTIIGSLFVNLATWATLAYFIRPVDFPIIIHYNVYFGVDILGNWWEAFLLPGVGTLFGVINLLLAYLAYQRKERIAAYLFLLASFIVQSGIAIASASIIKINF